MKGSSVLYFSSILIQAVFILKSSSYNYTTVYIDVPVDHFNFINNDSFKLRYLINDTYWNNTDSSDESFDDFSPNEDGQRPIFFYTGNEGAIEGFTENTGFVWEIAEEFNALIVFCEHRYYGKSMPYGNKSLSDIQYSGYLTSSQALEDFVYAIKHIKSTVDGAANSPVIAFGGSYGGMLSSWFRIKYPHIVKGAIASSAPILQFTGLTPCDSFGRVLSSDYEMESKECANTIRKSWKAIDSISSREDGRKWLSESWNLCKPITSSENSTVLKAWLADVWTNFGMANYPYPANFLAELPGYPVKEVCKLMTNSSLETKDLLQSIYKGLNLFFNYTGSAKCIDAFSQSTSWLGNNGWDFQACSEMVMPMCNDGVHDIFEARQWDAVKYSEDCIKKFGVKPDMDRATRIYGGKDISAASNIVFTNGLLDPWASGGVMKSVSDTVISLIIPEGAHHLDLRAANENDPKSVIDVRKKIRSFIRKWIGQKSAGVKHDADRRNMLSTNHMGNGVMEHFPWFKHLLKL